MELLRVNRKVLEITGAQRKLADKDSVAMVIGLIIFWPALFFPIGDNKKEELARLKREYEALEQAAVQLILNFQIMSFAILTQFLPEAFAVYIAESAAFNKSSPEAPCSG
jgi:hypothetical protein